MKILLVIISMLTLVACQESKEISAQALMQAKSGSKVIGKVLFKQYGDKLMIITDIEGLNPGQKHGFHIHEKGDCSAADAKSAGGHFAPVKHDHGSPDDAKHHAGDLGNLKANNQGIAKVELSSKDLSLLKDKKNSIIGKAVVIHAKNDDLKSQPSGNAGARIACGVVVE